MKLSLPTASPISAAFGAPTRPTLVALLLLGLSSAPALAAQPTEATSPVTVQTIDAEHIRVRIDNPAGQPGRVQVVRLSSGQTLFEEAYTAAYGHRFSFRDLPRGRYALLMTVGGRQYRYTVQVPGGHPADAPVAIRSIKVRLPKTEVATAAL
jgi:hypothetical protein